MERWRINLHGTALPVYREVKSNRSKRESAHICRWCHDLSLLLDYLFCFCLTFLFRFIHKVAEKILQGIVLPKYLTTVIGNILAAFKLNILTKDKWNKFYFRVVVAILFHFNSSPPFFYGCSLVLLETSCLFHPHLRHY